MSEDRSCTPTSKCWISKQRNPSNKKNHCQYLMRART
ncbi:hypothetical protein ANCDUO_23984 [Ancylostoma duodenale]|uniref:Uncharacterized protein n=1 Tax=Ancylostoma duodenale TaxID=51022 RepID=A0A0C2FM88_9BILA|nr:hypothetical protein ANCDUO_23984 [Ancylostoma duodenale]